MSIRSNLPFLAALGVTFAAAATATNCGSKDESCAAILKCCESLTEPHRSTCETAYDRLSASESSEEACREWFEKGGNDLCSAGPSSVNIDAGANVGSDAGVTPENSAEFVVLSAVDNGRRVFIRTRNRSNQNIPVYSENFSLVLETNIVLSGAPAEIEGDCRVQLAPNGMVECRVRFYETTPPRARGVRIEYTFGHIRGQALLPTTGCTGAAGAISESESTCRDGCDNDVDGFVDCEDRDCCSFVSSCSPESYCGREGIREENTLAQCSDSRDNDGDRFTDCDDFDCCSLRTDCPSSSACGSRSCNLGPETSLAVCTDGCSNDGDEWADCEERDCCSILATSGISCPTGSFCAE